MREIYSAGVIFSMESYLDTMSIFYTHHLNITHMTLALVFLAAFEYRELIDSRYRLIGFAIRAGDAAIQT